jgi:hypothetical protein
MSSQPRQVVAALDDPKLGTYILEILEHGNRWVHRRVESVEFRDHRTVTRSVSVDFTLPNDCPIVQIPDKLPVHLVPLASLKRTRLAHFHLWDETERAMSLLTTTEASQVISSGLIAIAETVVPTLQNEVCDDIRTIVGGKSEQAAAKLNEFENAVANTTRRRLRDNQNFFALLDTWSRLRVLLVPIKADEIGRRILKFRYDETFRYREKWRSFWKLRLAALPAVLEVPAAGDAQSYHFEVVAPEGVDFTEAALITAAGPKAPSEIDHIGGGLPRVHLRAAGVPRRSEASAQTSLRVARRGWLGAAAVCSLVMAGTLSVGAAWVALSFTKATGSAVPNLGNQAAALLVILPAIFATLLVRPQEHAMATRLLRVDRPLLFLSGLASYVAAGTLVIGPHDRVLLQRLWFGLAVFAVFAAVIISASFVFPLIRKRRSAHSSGTARHP